MRQSTIGPWRDAMCLCLGLLLCLAPIAGANQPIPPAASAGGSDQENALAVLDFRTVIQDAKERVFPSVIYIKVLRESMEGGRARTMEVAGSGVIISPDGLALTNWHVVDKAIEVRCLLTDGRAVNAKVVGSDKLVDLGLLQLELPDDVTGLPYAELGDSRTLREGDFVMAMGAPWGLNRSVSIGIISCVDRYLPDLSEYSLWLQTDASISPGNSGGPLVNTQGQVVGINTLGVLWGGNMAFTVPSATIQELMPYLIDHGQVNWSWTGLQLQPLRDFNRNMYFDAAEGVLVAETHPGSPARYAGLKARDRIVKINDQPITAMTEEDLPAIRRQLGLLNEDQPVQLTIMRGNEPITLEVVPREKGRVEGEELECPRWDMTVKAINQFDNPNLWFHRQQGVFIFGIRHPGNAASARLARQDIILKIGDRDIHTLDDVRAAHEQALNNIENEHRIRFTVLRNGLMRQVVLDFSRDYERN